jgi:O-antigen ligase
MEFAMAGLRMAADHPWLGVGLGEFSRYSPQYITQSLVDRFPAALYGENAHSQPIQIVAELGVIGLVAFVWYWIRVLGPAVRRLRSREYSGWLAAGTGGLFAFHLSALLGHPFLTPYVVFCVFVSVGVVAGLSAPVKG